MASSRKRENSTGRQSFGSEAKKCLHQEQQRPGKHRGSSLRSFFKEEGVLEEVEAAALKRALALEVADLMEKGDFNNPPAAECGHARGNQSYP